MRTETLERPGFWRNFCRKRGPGCPIPCLGTLMESWLPHSSPALGRDSICLDLCLNLNPDGRPPSPAPHPPPSWPPSFLDADEGLREYWLGGYRPWKARPTLRS